MILCIAGCSLFMACAVRPFLDRGDQLLDDGQTQAAIDVYEKGLGVEPTNLAVRDHLRRARQVLLEATWQQAVGELTAAHYDSALHTALRASKLVEQKDDAALAARAADLLQRVTQAAETYVGVLQAHGKLAPAAALSEQILSIRHDPQHTAWAGRVRAQVVDAFVASGQRAVSKHPGSAALQLALARRYGSADADERLTLKAAWMRFVERACFAEPLLEVRGEAGSHVGPLLHKLQDKTQHELSLWRNRCGRGVQPLHVHVILDGMEVIDQSATAPAAVARHGVQMRTEEPLITSETLSDTEETTAYEGRVDSVRHRDCPPGESGNSSRCHVWTEEVHRQVPVKRLRVVEHRRPVEHLHVLPKLPDAKIVRFERTTLTRRVQIHGHISVDGAGFVSVPFVVTAESTDSGHPEVGDGTTLLPADPLEARAVGELLDQAVERAANAIRTAVQEAARDWAAQQGEHALELEKAQPEAAEELYLRMLGLGLDNGQQVRTFFLQRYGIPADQVLGNLGTALGQEHHAGDGAAAADLTLLYPHKGG